MPQGIFVPPRSVVEASLPAWLEMATYTVPLDSISTANSTGEITLEYFPPDSILLLGIGWRLITAFSAASDDLFPELWFGDTADPKRFGGLNSIQLTDTGMSDFGSVATGFLPIFYQDTSSDGMTLAAWWSLGAGARVAADDTGAATILDTGELELWCQYRVRSGRSANRGSNVV